VSLTVADWAGGAASAEVCEAIIHFLLWLGTSCGHSCRKGLWGWCGGAYMSNRAIKPRKELVSMVDIEVY
jgi:hypothetical protein